MLSKLLGINVSELQIRGAVEDNSKIFFFLFLKQNIMLLHPSLEMSRRDGSNDEITKYV